MSTRTAIFQQQKSGDFIGIYVHYDGYIEGVGRTLFEHYKDRSKVDELLKKKRFLSCLGTTTEIISFEEHFEMHRLNKKDIEKYCVAHNDEEYFYAGNIEVIKDMQYITFANGEIDGYYESENQSEKFIPFRGSDNNGFLYAQDLKGDWYVSKSSETRPYKMKQFEKLEKYFK